MSAGSNANRDAVISITRGDCAPASSDPAAPAGGTHAPASIPDSRNTVLLLIITL
jgi:hypothetical protein